MIRRWPTKIAAVTLAVMLLIVGSARQGKSRTPSKSIASQPDTLPARQPIAKTGFEDKATGSWWGVRQRLKQAGLSIDASIVLEGFNNFRGGLRTSPVVGASTFDLSLTIETEKLLNVPGGKFYVDLEDHAGRNPTTVLVGDLQIFDKLNAKPYLQIFELWYQQKLFDDILRLKVGKVDANTEFSVIDYGLPFLNSSTQTSPTVFLLPTTPDPMPSVNVFFTPAAFYYASFGAYYANRATAFGNLVGSPQNAQLSEFGSFLIGETGLKWHHLPFFGYAGNMKLGAWGHTGTFPRLDGSVQQGTYGYYAIFDQTLWQPAGEPESGRGLRFFWEYGRTQRSISPIDQHFGGGFTWKGLLAARPKDLVGFSPQYGHITPEAGLPESYELVLEAFYRWQIIGWAWIMPDLQYIINPGGQYSNALVATIRLKLNF
jgi:porin